MIISYSHKNITAWSSTHGNREGGGEVTGLPRERGGVTPAHTGNPPPLLCAPPTEAAHGHPRSIDAVVAPKTSVLRMLGSLQEKETAQTRVADLRHRLNRLHWIDLYYACARS